MNIDGEPVTFESIANGIKEFKFKHPKPVTQLKCAPDYYKKLQNYFADEEAERERQGVKQPPKRTELGDLYGIRVVVDPDMKPGEWRFE